MNRWPGCIALIWAIGCYSSTEPSVFPRSSPGSTSPTTAALPAPVNSHSRKSTSDDVPTAADGESNDEVGSADASTVEDSGACLIPLSGSDSDFGPYDEFVLRALRLKAPTELAALVVSPSFKPPWVVSVHRRSRLGPFFVRVTRLDQDVWRLMLARMSDQQGAAVHLDETLQVKALAKLQVTTSTVEHAIDARTARLVTRAWGAVMSRAQDFETTSATADGVSYDFWQFGRAGTTVSPRYGSILERATYVAEWLSRFAETPERYDDQDVRHIQDELREILSRTAQGEPCTRRRE